MVMRGMVVRGAWWGIRKLMKRYADGASVPRVLEIPGLQSISMWVGEMWRVVSTYVHALLSVGYHTIVFIDALLPFPVSCVSS